MNDRKIEELKIIVQQAQAGDTEAYSLLVRRFQDMAVGYSYSILGDFGLAEDAAQEAFISAHRLLPQLCEAAAFPGWFRRIVFKHCDRLIRAKRAKPLALEEVAEMAVVEADLAETVEQREEQAQVQKAIGLLPVPEREILTLFYISQHSYKEVSVFLELPVTTVKSRLHTARQRLKERMLSMIQDNLSQQRPSKDENFAQNVANLLQASATGDLATAKSLLAKDSTLLEARLPVKDRLWVGEISSLHWAVIHQQYDIIELLLAQGADINADLGGMTSLQNAIDLYLMPDFEYDGKMIDFLLDRGAKMDIFAAMWLGKDELVEAMIRENPQLVHSKGPGNGTPLFFASLQLAKVLVDHGADIFARAEVEPEFKNPESAYTLNTPIRFQARWPNIPTLHFLLERAGVATDAFLSCVLDEIEQVKTAVDSDPLLLQAMTGEDHVLGPGLRLLHLAVRYNRTELVRFLLQKGADIQIQAPGMRGMTPLHVAAWRGLSEMARLLVELGADVHARNGQDQLTPLEVAEKVESDEIVRTEVAKVLRELGGA